MAVRLALPVLVLLVGDADEAAAETPAGASAPNGGWMVARAHDSVSMGVAIERALAAGRPALLDARS